MLGFSYDLRTPGWVRSYGVGHCTDALSYGGSYICVGDRGIFVVDDDGGVRDAWRFKGFEADYIVDAGGFVLAGWGGGLPSLLWLDRSFKPLKAEGFYARGLKSAAIHGVASDGNFLYLLLVANYSTSIVVKLSFDGCLEWARVVDAGLELFPVGITSLGGGCIVYGNKYPRGSYLIFLSGNGSLQRSLFVEGADIRSISCFDGDLFVAGRLNYQDSSVFVVRLSPEGDVKLSCSAIVDGFKLISNFVGLSTADGGYIACSGSFPAGFVVIRFSPHGVVEWARAAGPPNHRVSDVVESDGYLLFGDTGGFIPRILACRTNVDGAIPGYRYMSVVGASFSTPNVTFKPVNITVTTFNLHVKKYNVLVMEMRMTSYPCFEHLVLVSISIKGLEITLYLIGVEWLLMKIRDSHVISLTMFRPDHLKLAVFLFMLLSCYGFTIAGHLASWLSGPPARGRYVYPGYKSVSSFLLFVPSAVAFVALFPLVVIGVVNPNPVFGSGLNISSPVIILPVLYVTSCLFSYSLWVFGKPSVRELLLAAVAYLVAVGVGVFLGYRIAYPPWLGVEPPGVPPSLVLWLVLLFPFLVIFYYAYFEALLNIVRGRFWLREVARAEAEGRGGLGIDV